ncbi:MAG TPA: hypothetical protein DIU15_04385 [Deltaproteobacteria bacterium]|nr:hypothetical protein [Deltaproteobacteria bacterium]HCP45251.1 hypothetical protein [Deltaproteobacteria bacterium]
MGGVVDLQRMLKKCHSEQWSVGDLDWSRPPKPMLPETERAIVQYFTDMAGIERLAGALFEEQRKRAVDPVLEEIFSTFVQDELRHAHVAQMLADYYNVHHYEHYQTNGHLLRFAPHFVNAIRYLSNEIANAYITSGELILDIALLRSINDFVDDAMSQEAMDRVNRDESRHIAIDFHMVEYYCSDEYIQTLKQRPPLPPRERIRAAWSFTCVLWFAAPFFKAVFFEPMDLVDPEGKRMMEAFRRIQLLSRRNQVKSRPFVRFMLTLQDLYNTPVVGRVLGRVLRRTIGVDPRFIVQLYSEVELERTNGMSFDALAQEALAVKYA